LGPASPCWSWRKNKNWELEVGSSSPHWLELTHSCPPQLRLTLAVVSEALVWAPDCWVYCPKAISQESFAYSILKSQQTPEHHFPYYKLCCVWWWIKPLPSRPLHTLLLMFLFTLERMNSLLTHSSSPSALHVVSD
jgi:hypothetical protein